MSTVINRVLTYINFSFLSLQSEVCKGPDHCSISRGNRVGRQYSQRREWVRSAQAILLGKTRNRTRGTCFSKRDR